MAASNPKAKPAGARETSGPFGWMKSLIPQTIIGGLTTHVTILSMTACVCIAWIGGGSATEAIRSLAIKSVTAISIVLGLTMIFVTTFSPSTGMLSGPHLVKGLELEEKRRRVRSDSAAMERSTPPTPPTSAAGEKQQ